jgi:cellulase/cellobiase CelA1
MAEEDQQGSNISVSVPIGVLASAAVLGASAAAYLFLNSRGESSTTSSPTRSDKGKGLRRKVGLTTVITLLENDASRKVVLTVLRAMARRA